MRLKRLLGRLHPVRLVQGMVVLFNFPPFTWVFHLIYAAGVRLVVWRIARHPAVHAVYGTGSFFDGKPLYGHSDVDLVIALRNNVPRNEGVQHDLRSTYNRLRPFFPMLGGWSEKEGSLVFLEEVEAGFTVSASFSLRMRTGQFTLLAGDDVPLEFPGPPNPVELLEEIGTLQRVCLLTGEKATLRLIFWQRVFLKLLNRAELLGLDDLVARWREDRRLTFLGRPPRSLYFTGASAATNFGVFMELVEEIYQAVGGREEHFEHEPAVVGRPEPLRRSDPPAYLDGLPIAGCWSGPSIPLSLTPRLFYFSIDDEIRFVEISGDSYDQLRRLIASLKANGAERDAVVVRTGASLLLLTRQEDYVDVIPLDPLAHAPVHAHLAGSSGWSMPQSVYRALTEDADGLFEALSNAYRRHTGWLPKRSYPAIYREDDFDTIRDAFDIARSYLAFPARGELVSSAAGLVALLAERYPSCARMLELQLEYFRYLTAGGHGESPANNLYRSLHQFMAQLLAGASEIETDDPDRHLSITVGIITRNRAPDLVNALESLVHQTRPPDEIVIVDNGSTDNTKEVIDSFADRLTFRYQYLADASIPLARNQVLELATGEVVAFTDDDCGIPEGWLSAVERGFLRADNVGIVGGWVEHWPADVPSTVDTYYEIFHGHKT